MAAATTRQQRRQQMILGTGWTAGIGIMLVEMHYGVDYVLSHVVGNVSALVDWLPMIGTLVGRFWA